MTRSPAHNSTVTLPISYRGKVYVSFMHLFREVVPPPVVGEVTLGGRFRRGLEKHGCYEDGWIGEALYLDAKAFRRKHGTRRTWGFIDGERVDLKLIYDEFESAHIEYATFRQRVVKRRDLTMAQVRDAAMFNPAEWNTHYGRGGRRTGFIYQGDLYPKAHGEYSAVTSFLKTVGRYEDRKAVNHRLKRGWDIDDALSRSSIDRDCDWSMVYKITQLSSGRKYVGITVRGQRSRWREHLKAAFETGASTPLYQAMRQTGVEDFRIEVIEEGAMSGEALAERERHWIDLFNTMLPSGFNSAPGGSIGRVEGLPISVDGVIYQSREAAVRAISKTTGLAEHVVRLRIIDGRPFPEKARQHSQHPEAGTVLFRKWLGLIKRAREGASAEVVAEWGDYDTWKRQADAEGKEGFDLYRPDRSAQWGPSNFAWGSTKDRVTSAHGRKISAFGKTWPSKAEACREYGIGVGTFNFRLKAGMNVEEALTQPLGKTSRRGEPFVFEEESFRSITHAANILSERHAVSPEQARDRIRRGIETARWPRMGKSRVK